MGTSGVKKRLEFWHRPLLQHPLFLINKSATDLTSNHRPVRVHRITRFTVEVEDAGSDTCRDLKFLPPAWGEEVFFGAPSLGRLFFDRSSGLILGRRARRA